MGNKKCKRCYEAKPLNEFYKRNSAFDGLQSFCKKCKQIDDRNYRKRNKEKIKEYSRVYYRKHTIRVKKARIKYSELNPEKVKAYKIFHNAVNSGKIIRQPCEVCGKTKTVQGHHEDYNRPLDVNWLCCHHHVFFHQLKGDRDSVVKG